MSGYTVKDSAGNAIITGDVIVENPTLYVNASTGDDTNTGSASDAALATIQAAVNKLGTTIRGTATIEIAAGTYREEVNINNISGGKLVINGASASTTIISGADSGAPTTVVRDYCIYFFQCCIGQIEVKNMRLEYSDVAGYRSDYGAGVTTVENVEIQNIDGHGWLQLYSGQHNAVNVDISTVLSHGFYLYSSSINFKTTASTVSQTSTGGSTSGMPIRAFYNSYVGILVAGCSFSGNTSIGTYSLFLDNSIVFHSTGFTIAEASYGIRARWNSQVVGTGTITYTNVDTNSSLTSGATIVNGD